MLSRLLKHSEASKFEITVLVRNAEKAKILQENFGLTAIVGTHQELDKVKHLAEKADVIFDLVRSADKIQDVFADILTFITRQSRTTCPSLKPSSKGLSRDTTRLAMSPS